MTNKIMVLESKGFDGRTVLTLTEEWYRSHKKHWRPIFFQRICLKIAGCFLRMAQEYTEKNQ